MITQPNTAFYRIWRVRDVKLLRHFFDSSDDVFHRTLTFAHILVSPAFWWQLNDSIQDYLSSAADLEPLSLSELSTESVKKL